LNLDSPIGESAWNCEKDKKFGSVWADYIMGVREFMEGRRKGAERERMKEKLGWRGED